MLSPQVVALLNPVPAWRARLLLARGEVAEAARWADERGISAKDEPSYPREGESLVLARVLLAQQEPDQALGLLERLHDLAVAQGRTGSVIELRALLSRIAEFPRCRSSRFPTLSAPEGRVTTGWSWAAPPG